MSDEELGNRIRQVENQLLHYKATLPQIMREIEALISELQALRQLLHA